MLEKLRIQNFKSWQDTGDMAFGSLTGFFGTNSSGKSSILQFLLMLKQTVESSDRSRVLHLGDDKSYVDLGTMYDILFMHENPSLLSFDFSWMPENPSYTDASLVDVLDEVWLPETVSFKGEIRSGDDYVELIEFAYGHDESIVSIHKQSVKPEKEGNDLAYQLSTVFGHRRIKEPRLSDLIIKPSKFYSTSQISHLTVTDPKKFTREVPKLLDYGIYELERLFYGMSYLGPLREYPSRLYAWAGEQTQSVGNRGERAVAALLSSRNQGPTIDMGPDQPKRTVEEHVAHWLKELGLIYSFKVQPIAPNRKEYEVRIQRTAESASVFLTDVGFGVSQILPVLVLLFYVPEGSTVILEQPEIHLHPAVQAGLADVFIDAIKRRRLQIVLESHSEHLLQRLQRRMAEFTLEPEKAVDPGVIKLYFTSIKEGRSELTTLDLDEYGNIRNWPEGFFGDTLGEAAAMMKAEMRRKMREQQA
jgi:predicted ATPase